MRNRIRGRSLDTGVAKTVCWERDVEFDEVSDVLSIWHTYLRWSELQKLKEILRDKVTLSSFF